MTGVVSRARPNEKLRGDGINRHHQWRLLAFESLTWAKPLWKEGSGCLLNGLIRP
jgi:hypothetical protein